MHRYRSRNEERIKWETANFRHCQFIKNPWKSLTSVKYEIRRFPLLGHSLLNVVSTPISTRSCLINFSRSKPGFRLNKLEIHRSQFYLNWVGLESGFNQIRTRLCTNVTQKTTSTSCANVSMVVSCTKIWTKKSRITPKYIFSDLQILLEHSLYN